MPKSFSTKPRKPKPPVSPKEQWETFPPGILGRHWKRVQNPKLLRTTGLGYACLILTEDSCSHFVKRCTFEDHMRSVHRLNPDTCPRGRPKTSLRQRNPPTAEATLRNRKTTLGSWPLRVWKAKKGRMEWLLRWAYNNIGAHAGDPTQWSILKAQERGTFLTALMIGKVMMDVQKWICLPPTLQN